MEDLSLKTSANTSGGFYSMHVIKIHLLCKSRLKSCPWNILSFIQIWLFSVVAFSFFLKAETFSINQLSHYVDLNRRVHFTHFMILTICKEIILLKNFANFTFHNRQICIFSVSLICLFFPLLEVDPRCTGKLADMYIHEQAEMIKAFLYRLSQSIKSCFRYSKRSSCELNKSLRFV